MNLIGLLLFVLVALLFVSPVLSAIAIVRVRAMRREFERVNALEAKVAALQRRVSSPRPEAAADVAPAPHPEPERAAPPTPTRPPAPSRSVTAPPPRRSVPPPPPRPAAPPAAPAAPPPRPKIDWEHWLGIRGAAVLGAIALGLAGLLFFKYSIERGLITPTMRVVLGTLTGLGCLVGSRVLRRREFTIPAQAVAGAGIIVLYAAFWAAHVLYGLIGPVPAFGLMILVTVTCCVLALRDDSLLVAVLGLVGGFATPLLLSSGSDRPIGLFGYVLLLDLGLLVVGHKRRWPSLGLLSLLATVALEALWVGARMGPDRLLLALAILAVFAVLFVVAGRVAGDGAARRTWLWSQAGAVFFPFFFALYFAGRVELGERLWPVALLLALLCAAAGWLARERNVAAMGAGAAVGSIAVVAVWLTQHRLDTFAAWELVAVAVGLPAVFHLFVELRRKPFGLVGPAPAAILAAGGFFALTVQGAVGSASVTVWPWIVGWALLATLLYRHATFPARGALQLAAAGGLGVGLTTLHFAHSARPSFPEPLVFYAVLVAAGVALQTAAWLRRREEFGVAADRAAALLPVVLLVGLSVSPLAMRLEAPLALGATLVLGLLVLLAAARLGSGTWYAAGAGATALAQTLWVLNARPDTGAGASLATLAFAAVTVLLFTGWLFVAPARFGSERWARWAAALAGPLWFPALKELFERAFGDSAIGILPLTLGAVSLGAVARARTVWSDDERTRVSALAWFAAVALGFVSVAIPLQLDREWITVGWALEGLAVIALWRRLDHPGLKYFGLALLAAVTVRLVANPAVLAYYPRSGMRVLNWLLYTYLVPTAALLGSAALLLPLEVPRLRSRELPLYAGRPLGTIATSFAAIVVVFVWINLAIADWFATGSTLTLSFGSTPAQRLTVSIAWALYALVLLGFGMGRDVQALRWVSLSFLLVTIGKVFLYDLGALEDLYRVASLVGLAVSLILVSVLYQRFVFRRDGGRE